MKCQTHVPGPCQTREILPVSAEVPISEYIPVARLRSLYTGLPVVLFSVHQYGDTYILRQRLHVS